MSSRRDAILDALFAALNGASKPAGLTVGRARTLAYSTAQLPGQALYPVAEEIAERQMRGLDNKVVVRRRLRVCVETRVNAASDTTDQAIDQYLTWAVKAICATPQLPAKLTHDITEEGTVWESADQDAVLSSAKQFFQVEYVTAGNDPDAATAG